MRYVSDKQLLDLKFRQKVISEIIDGFENIQRRSFAERSLEIFKGKSKKWVMQALGGEGFTPTTLFQMQNRASNISIARKIVKKLAFSYVGGVSRTVDDPQDQQSLDALSDELDINTMMKKVDQYRQLFKNCLLQVVPILNRRESLESAKFDIVLRPLAPHQYDVIEDSNDKQTPRIVILSEFKERYKYQSSSIFENEISGIHGRRSGYQKFDFTSGDGKDQIIADSPEDADSCKRRFIIWSDSYHFTMDESGNIIEYPNLDETELEAQIANPIGILPFVNFAQDQDGKFWAQGGNDLIDMDIKINKDFTDLSYVVFTQGFGQPVMVGNELQEDKIVGGPNNLILLNQRQGDPTPQFYFASSNPPVDAWLNVIRSEINLLLTTNGLSPKNIQAEISGNDPASGIAKLIEQSEVIGELQDVQELFRDKEPLVWDLVSKWQTLLLDRSALSERFSSIAALSQTDISLKFVSQRPVISETERLEALRKRKELGINTMAELIQLDNPDLSLAEAEAKLALIKEEKMARVAAFMPPASTEPQMQAEPDTQPEDESQAE